MENDYKSINFILPNPDKKPPENAPKTGNRDKQPVGVDRSRYDNDNRERTPRAEKTETRTTRTIVRLGRQFSHKRGVTRQAKLMSNN